MAYLLDTCVLSEFTKPRPSSALTEWMSGISDADQFVSTLTLGELERGVARLAPGKRRASLELWLREITKRLADRILPVDTRVAIEWGQLCARSERAGSPLPVVDALIGATALVHGHKVVTRNASDIGRTGAEIIDPWST